ncbi:MAG: RNA-guided endonuclease TnpB family protein [Nanoarchaeota archaeon]
MKTFKYRLYPTKSQSSKMDKQLEICRQVYNGMLEHRKSEWENKKNQVSAFDLINMLPKQKKERPELNQVHADVLQNLSLRLEKAFKGFFARIKKGDKPGYPRFKGRGRFRSMVFPKWGAGIRIQHDRLRIPKIGLVKIIYHRPCEGMPKTGTVTKHSNDWYLTISCEGDFRNLLPKTEKSCGLDLGVRSFCTTNEGIKIDNPRFFEQDQKAVGKAQRKKKWGVVRKIYKRIVNKRHDFQFKLANQLVKDYDQIFVEDLNINKMLTKRWCSKQISDVSWRSFLNILEYKAENAGKQVVKVNPAYTSQTCSECKTATTTSLKEEVFTCCSCGFSSDRDINAAKNIMTVGLYGLVGSNNLEDQVT